MPISSSKLLFSASIAGVWKSVDDQYVTATNTGALANSFFGTAKLGLQQWNGVVMTGWQYSGFSNTATDVVPVNLGILAQQADGTLRLDTASYVSSAVTNGGGSVLVADFNADGRSDVFLAAHNESPFISKASTVLMSNSAGTFTKLTLGDRVMAHDAQLATVNGVPIVVTAAFANDKPGPTNPSYTWNGTGFTQTESPVRNSASSMSVAMADFNGDGQAEMVLGDFFFGPGLEYNPANKFKIAVFSFRNGDITGNPLSVITPYFEARAQYAGVNSMWGPANTHSYRVWIDDFNHDGRPDIVAGQSLWTTANNTWPSTLQMLQNQGNFQFADKTDTLNASYDKDSAEVDYNMQMVDLDGSGIKSYLSGTRTYDTDSRQANYLLLNDGTGKLHVGLHDEFVELGKQAVTHAAAIYNNFSSGVFVSPTSLTPKFHGYVTNTGKLNFVAEIYTGNESVLVNVPLALDVRTDFTTAIDIADRNGSKLMRTFAGNDTIRESNAAATASIDAGLGIDTAIYNGARAGYTVTRVGNTVLVSKAGLADTLTNVERLQFSDAKVAMDINGNGGQAYRLYQAAFNRTPDQAGFGYQMNALDTGLSLSQVAANFIASPEFQRTYGALDDARFVTQLYQNVLHRAPDAAGLAYHTGNLGRGMARADVLVGFSESPENQAALIGVIQNGMVYS